MRLPLPMLRVSLEIFAFARRLTYKKSVAQPVHSLSAILAGSGMAQVALTMVLAGPLRQIIEAFPQRPLSTHPHATAANLALDAGNEPSLRVCVYVDDIALHVIGTSKQASAALVTATGMVIKLLEEDLCMVVSRRSQWATEGKGKTEVAVTDPRVHSAIKTSMRRLGIKIKSKATHLGIAFRPGARTRTPALEASRWAAGAKRRLRAQRMGRRLGQHVFLTGILLAATYGATVA